MRLGEDNFRLGLYGELGDYGGLTFEKAIAQAQTGLRVWARQCDAMNAKDATASVYPIALPESAALDLLPKIVVKPPHCLEELQRDRAIGVTIDRISVLIWRHQLLSHSVFELHTAVEDVEAITLQLRNR